MSDVREHQQQQTSAPEPGTGEPERTVKRTWSGAFKEAEEGVENPTDPSKPQQKRRAVPRDVMFRLVVPSRHIGRVIGKEGSRIRKIRQETKANIKIADAVNREEERVIIINSTDNECEVSDAERALLRIAETILQEDNVGTYITNIGIEHVAANVIQLLIAGSQAGCLIGKSGQNIEKLRISSGATVSILPKNQFPMCTSAHESDRLVQILGGIPEILKALEMISCQIRENTTSKVVSVRPTYNLSVDCSNQTFLSQTSADYITSEMTVPESLVGGLIGKSGSNISRIRNESGAAIKVSGGRGSQEQRCIYFGGSSQQVALARKLIDDYIYSQSSQWQCS